ncbi:MAG TPA: hypothetical protein P5119_03495 [Candidatus Aminicenantes bacterium]|nr:hypothetical protein [Candidatus Aminicenantes bacterium]HRY64388.1 hypothetical protein [Candidatus Aminicenantes bacterium]HRZ71301.1 hypothetical protein [Candidatus Aminicenantes bacterium]
MKRTTLACIPLILLIVGISNGQASRPPDFSGPYFGQAPPGAVPQRFAPGFVSTAGYDLTPTFSPGLDEVFFGRRASEEGSDNKIYYSRMTRGRWEEPVPAAFSSGAAEYEAQFSPDGGRVYFNRGKMIFFSQRTEAGWSEARPVAAPADEGMCAAPARNGTLYFTAARNKVYGIFRSGYDGGRYLEPEIVVRMAAHPWVAPDESFLVFDKYAFAGGAQTSKLYASFRRTDGSWSDPVELGKDINATGTELIPKISPDGKYLFFQRKIDGNTDVYWVDAKVIEAVR